MRLQHVVITRFCYRGADLSSGGPGRRRYDPLHPDNLAQRFRLLEIATLPGMLAQTEQDFTWLFLVDRDLDDASRRRLATLVGDRPRTVLHEYDPSVDYGDARWLAPHLDPFEAGDYLLTTNLDDDDALPRNFVAELHTLVRERVAAVHPPLLMLGATRPIEWDLVLSRRAPFGLTAPWHRRDLYNTHVPSAGFSLAGRQPAYPFTVLTRNHGMARRYLDFATPAGHPDVERARPRFEAAAQAAGDDLRAYPPGDTFADLAPATGPVLMTNHALNLQETRLLEAKPDQAIVQGPQTFPSFELGWDALRREAKQLRAGRGYALRRSRFRGTRSARRWARRARARLRRLRGAG